MKHWRLHWCAGAAKPLAVSGRYFQVVTQVRKMIEPPK